MDKKIAETVLDRAGGYCEKCGGVLSDSYNIHHRKLKSRGGIDEVSNLIVVHNFCHIQHKESIHDNPDTAERMGFMCPSWRDPSEHPLIRPDGSIVLLLGNGTYHLLEKAK
jgi:hypothetical protein